MKLRKTWAEAYQPYAQALRKLKLPRRYKARDPRNLRRCGAVCKALHKLKEELRAKEKRR
jgi:hypothetical protein